MRLPPPRRLRLSLGFLLLVFLARTEAETVRLANADQMGAYRGVEDTTMKAAQPDASFGGAATLGVGAGEKALLRFSAAGLPAGTKADAATVELTLEKIEGEWKDAELVGYAVAPGAAGWTGGKGDGQSENGATCWNYLLYSDVKNIQTGLAMHTPMAGQAGFGQAGKDYLPAPLARVKLVPGIGPQKVSLPLGDPATVQGWIDDKSVNPGLLLVVEGLPAGSPARAVFDSSEAASGEARPALSIKTKGSAVPESSGPVGDGTIHYELKQAARVSLVVCDAQGQVVRELLHAAERTAGPHDEAWDGVDETGAKAAPGTYTWKLLQTQGLKAEYLMTLGLSVDFFQLWPGNHVGVTGVAVDDSGVYLGSGCSEARGFVMKMGADGTRLWAVNQNWFEAWQGPHSLAVDGDRLFMMEENYDVIRLAADKGTAGPIWDLVYDKTKSKDRPSSTRDDGGWVKMKLGQAGETAAVDLAAGKGRLVMSYESFGCIRWIDEEKGKVLHETRVKEPLGVAVDNQGRALVVTEGAVVAFSDGSDTPTTVIPASALVSPWRLSVNRATGEIWVAERGASQQVKKFSPDGQLLQAFGAVGGRPAQGLYDGQAGFRNVNSIAAAADGTFWVTEAFAAPRRVAHFDAEGKLLREWYGPQMYANRAAADPADPSLVWMDSMWGEVIEAKVDYAKKTWTVLATYSYMNPLQPRYRHEGGMWYVCHANGKTYLAKETEPDVFLVDEPGRRLVPMSKVGVAYYPGGNAAWQIPKEWQPADGSSPWHYTWFNKTGDPAIPPADLTFGKELYTFPHDSFVRPDLTYVTAMGVSWKDAGGQWVRQGGPTILKPTSFTSGGAPVYDPAQAGNLPIQVPGFLEAIRSMTEDADGNIFTAHNTVKSRAGQGPFGVGKTASGIAGNYVAKWGSDGSLKWIVGRHTAAAKPGEGEVRNFYRMAGTVKGCIAVNDIDYGMTHVWDRDGLWVGRLLESGVVNDAIPRDAYDLCGENFGGYVFENKEDGQVYFFGDSFNATPVYRITGWDRFERQQGRVELK